MEDTSVYPVSNQIAFIGNYLPRQCGIATFTTDLCQAVAAEYPEAACIAVPVNDVPGGYQYPECVRFELTERDIESYRRAADYLNINNVDVVSLQFEYGIFGGQSGSHILALLRELHMPVVTTLHTILRDPEPDQRGVLEEVAALSDRLVVMSERGAEFLREIYCVPGEKIDVIPHGIPDLPFVDPSYHKDIFGVEGKLVLLTFGLLSANKGIETVINALPEVVKRYPDVVYIILGATHPHVLNREGEAYRLSLQRLACEKGVKDHVIFHNRFVSNEELMEFIGAADIYITPYLGEAQIVSGTLAYTLGAGKSIVSTPYWYADEMLADGRGVLVPFADPGALAKELIYLIENESERHAMRKRAYLFGREMTWPRVAALYMESFKRARTERRSFVSRGFGPVTYETARGELPLLKLDHLRRMTDDTGILQHALMTVPNYEEGYTTDDNARALLVAALLDELGVAGARELESRYMAFVAYAFSPATGRFRNFLDYNRRWLEVIGSEDCQGRALLALSVVLGRSGIEPMRNLAGLMFDRALPSILETTSPRAWAFTLIGIHEYLRRYSGDRRAAQVRDELARRLLKLYRRVRSGDWFWFEDSLTYCNAVLPQAMIMCGQWIPDSEMTAAGLESLGWLAEIQCASPPGGHFVPIGSNGFYVRGSERARFDQQPVEAQAMVSACLEAYRSTGEQKWYEEARRAFEWFSGSNDLNLSVYDPSTGGCRDGLHSDRLNENQGAESTLAFLQALLELRMAETTILSRKARS